MLKYKKHTFASIATTVEDLSDMLAGMSGKNRRLVGLFGEVTALLYFRVYRDGEQIIDVPCDQVVFYHHATTLTGYILPCDVPLAEGQLLKVGYYNNTGGTITTQEIVIAYEESG